MNKRSRNILIASIIVVVLVAGGAISYFFRDRLFTAVGTSQIPGLDLTWQVELTGTNQANQDTGDAITASAGDTINFTVNYSESSPGGTFNGNVFQGAVLFVPLDGVTGLTNISGISGGGSMAADPYNPGRNGVVWSLGDLSIPASGSESFSATVDPNLVPPASITLSAEFRGVEFTPPAISQMTITLLSIQTPPGGNPSLTMVKNVEDVNGAPVERGDLLKYTLTLENTGQATATGIKVTEDIPLKLEQFSVPIIATPPGAVDDSTATGGANGNGYLDVNNFSLLPTASTTIVYSVVVSTSAQDKEVIDNVATAVYTQNPTPLQSSAQVIVSVAASPVVIPDEPPGPSSSPLPPSSPGPASGQPVIDAGSPATPTTVADNTGSPSSKTTNPSSGFTTNNPTTGTIATTTPTQAVVVPEVGGDPSLIALGGSGAVSLLVGAGYYLRKKRKIK